MSSSGTSPVFVVRMKKTNKAQTATKETQAIHFRRRKNDTPFLYFSTKRLNEASKAWWKREEKLNFSPVVLSM